MRAPPPGGEFAFMQAEDGASIRYAFWPGQEGKPTIVFLPGFRETIEKHFETIDDLLKRGLSVFTLDWRGQGLSTRALENPQKTHVEDFELYVADLRQLIATRVKPATPGPHYFFCHSMGGHIALRFLHDERYEMDGAILSAPMFDIWTPPGLRFLFTGVTKLVNLLGFAQSYGMGRGEYGPVYQKFDGNRLTSDKARFEEDHNQLAAQPALQSGGPTWGWFGAAWSSIRLIRDERYLKAIGVPIYIVQAGEDGVVSNRAHNWFDARMNTSHIFRIEGARHEILREQDIYRDQLWALFDRFFEVRG
jgi:lysophospholipase